MPSNQEINKEIDAFLQKMYDQKLFNGTLLLAQDGEITYERSFGYSNPHKMQPLDENASFRLASVSKQFTCMGIMILQEQGKLNYDDDIRKHIPELPYEGVTIRHLMHHTSGLPDYTSWFDFNWDKEKAPADKKTAFNKDVVEQFAKHKPEIDFKPGERYEYSNTGYVVLGNIIERVSGQPIRDFMKEHIFDKAGMVNTQAFSPFDDFTVENRVYGFSYTADGAGYNENDWNYLNGMIGDGGIYATARDLLAWDQALYTDKIVKQSTIEEAFVSGKLNNGEETGYGFGWGISETSKGGRQVSHSGGWVGFRTYIIRLLDEKYTVVLLTNNSCQHLGNILTTLKAIREGENYDTPKPPISLAIAQEINQNGTDGLAAKYEDLKANKGNEYDFAEPFLNMLGYDYLNAQKYEEAIAIFKINVKAYPKSANTYDSLGEAYLEASKVNYQQSLDMNPGNDHAKDVLKSLGVAIEEDEALSEETLANFVGKYELAPNVIFTITLEGNQLMSQLTGQPAFPIYPESKTKFYYKIVDAQISFQKGEDGKVSGLTLHQNGANQPAKKVE